MSVEKLAAAVKARRAELGWTQKDVAALAHLSLDRIQAVEACRHPGYREATLRKLDRALCWTTGSAAAVLAGAEVLGYELPPEPPVVLEVELREGTTRAVRIIGDPNWAAIDGTLDVFDDMRLVATFAAGQWVLIRTASDA